MGHKSNSPIPVSALILMPDIVCVGQYNAWCRNNGNHSTPKRGHQDWNREIVWKMRSDLGFQWELVEDEVSDVFGPLLESVRGILCDLKSVLLREFCLHVQ